MTNQNVIRRDFISLLCGSVDPSALRKFDTCCIVPRPLYDKVRYAYQLLLSSTHRRNMRALQSCLLKSALQEITRIVLKATGVLQLVYAVTATQSVHKALLPFANESLSFQNI